MGRPADEPAAYAASSVLTHAHRISGRLLLVHGLLDENVHARHTMRLVKRLAERNVPHELLLLPSERHVPRDPEARAFAQCVVCEMHAGFAAWRSDWILVTPPSDDPIEPVVSSASAISNQCWAAEHWADVVSVIVLMPIIPEKAVR